MLVGFTLYLNRCYVRNLPLWIGFCSLCYCRNQLPLNQMIQKQNILTLLDFIEMAAKSFPDPRFSNQRALAGNDYRNSQLWMLMPFLIASISLFVVVTQSSVCWSMCNFLVYWSIQNFQVDLKVSYEFELPQQLAAIRPMFHVFMLSAWMILPSSYQLRLLRSKRQRQSRYFGGTNFLNKLHGKLKRT